MSASLTIITSVQFLFIASAALDTDKNKCSKNYIVISHPFFTQEECENIRQLVLRCDLGYEDKVMEINSSYYAFRLSEPARFDSYSTLMKRNKIYGEYINAIKRSLNQGVKDQITKLYIDPVASINFPIIEAYSDASLELFWDYEL